MSAKESIVVSFSGGKTSAYMCFFLLMNYSDQYNFIFIFANTGLELEETLIFVNKVDMALGLNLVWVEAVVNPKKGKGVRYKIVDFKSASRKGEPFEAYISKEGIPNATYMTCSDRLKRLAINDYKKDNNLKGLKTAIGIRTDESHRKSKNPHIDNLIYPLCDWFESDKQDVNTFWEGQSFTLELEEHEGNCGTCWKKSDKKLYLIALEHPERFEFFRRMEEIYGYFNSPLDGRKRVFFRRNRSVEDIFKEAELYNAEILRKYIGYESDQLDMFGGCGESCEAFF